MTQLIPKTKIPAHKRYSLRCKFSPDSTYVHPKLCFKEFLIFLPCIVESICVSCRLLATCSADQTCKIWRTSNFSLMTELSIKSNNPGETSRGWMWDCAFSGDSQYIVTGEHVMETLGVQCGNIMCIIDHPLFVPFLFFTPI